MPALSHRRRVTDVAPIEAPVLTMLIRAGLIWLIIMVLAILNGGFREAVLLPPLGYEVAHLFSTIILCLIILVVAWLTILWIAPRSRRDALSIGVAWLVLTIAFEFLAGHYLFGTSWDELLSNYNVLRGRIWPLVPLTTFFAPLWASAARG